MLIVAGDAIGRVPGARESWDTEAARIRKSSRRSPRPASPPVWPGPSRWVYTGGAARPLVEAAAGVAAVALLDVGSGVVVAIADAALLWNGAFVHPNNERFLGDLVYLGQGLEGWPVEHAGPGPARDPGRRVPAVVRGGPEQPPQVDGERRPVVVGPPAARDLGPRRDVAGLAVRAAPRNPPDQGRLSFVEHVTAVGTRYWRSRDSGYAAKQYAALWVARLGVEGLQSAAHRAGFTPRRGPGLGPGDRGARDRAARDAVAEPPEPDGGAVEGHDRSR